MELLKALLALLSLLLVASISSARHDPGEYWQSIMKDEAMPEAIHGLMDERDSTLSRPSKKTDCHTSTKEKHDVDNFEPRPNISAYNDVDVKLIEKTSGTKDFEPRPNVSAYDDNDVKLIQVTSGTKDFESRPSTWIYKGNDNLKENKGFEPRPAATN